MQAPRPPSRYTLLAALLMLAACGGGGGGGSTSSTASPPEAIPTSGSYGWLLKAQGSTASLNYGLSLVHTSAPSTEFVIELPSAAVTDARVVASGNVDAPGLAVTAMNPQILVYIVGGDVRRVSLQANGKAPKSQVQSAGTASACAFLSEAIDHAAPEQSRFIVSTAGADGLCATSDDGQAEVRLGATAPGIVYAPLTGARVLAPLRDPGTLAPRGWLTTTSAQLWAGSSESALTVRAAASPLSRALLATHRSVLAESSGGLSVVDFSGGTAFKETAVGTANSTGWQGVGYDALYFYAYRNSSADLTSSWQMLRIARTAPSATVLASGSGRVDVASLGSNYLYLTVRTSSNNQLLRLNKNVPGASPQVLENTAATTLSTVLTSSADVHQLWRVSGLSSSTPGYTVEMIDETGSKLFTSTGGGFPLLLAAGSTLNLNASESRSTFVFADRYGSRYFGDAALTLYDARTRSATVAGTLPGSADFGSDFVVANVNGGPTSGVLAGFAARSIGGVVQSAGTRVFSFVMGTGASLKFATSQQ